MKYATHEYAIQASNAVGRSGGGAAPLPPRT
jgi:hypothetical protein